MTTKESSLFIEKVIAERDFAIKTLAEWAFAVSEDTSALHKCECRACEKGTTTYFNRG